MKLRFLDAEAEKKDSEETSEETKENVEDKDESVQNDVSDESDDESNEESSEESEEDTETEGESEEDNESEEENDDDENFTDVAYWWKATQDDRVRRTHMWMNNCIVIRRHAEDERPKLSNCYGDAGELPNCRCRQMPLKKGAIDPNKKYKVYNFKSGKGDKPSGTQYYVKGETLIAYLHKLKHNTLD